MRILKNTVLTLLVVLGIIGVGFTFWVRDRYVVPILTYHHVGTSATATKEELNTVSEESFEYQMRFMKRHGFQVISFDDLVKGIRQGQEFARNTVVIQFDDGYEDNYTNAFPILKKYKFPAIIFLISDRIDTPGFLTWDQIKEMENDNVMAGAHTRNHVYLPQADALEARYEIAGSKKEIEGHLGHAIDYFSYPSGGFTEEAKHLLQEAGFKAAVTTNRGKDRFNRDLYELKRIHVNNTDSRYSGMPLWFKLSGYYNIIRRFKDGGGTTKTSSYD